MQVLLDLSKFPLFPFSHFIEASDLVGGTVVNKEGGWCELKCCQGGHLSREPAAPVHAPMGLEVWPLLPCKAAHFTLACGVAIFTDWG